MTRFKKIFFGAILLFCIQLAWASTVIVQMHLVTKDGPGKNIGAITAKDTLYGLLLTPNLHGLAPGIHGMHIHQKPSCAKAAMAAGGHYDPHKTGKHLGPYSDKGHLGDLPVLIVAKNGTATTPVLAPRLTTIRLKGHALMIHLGGDNYSDQPKKLGGGGKRYACGVVK